MVNKKAFSLVEIIIAISIIALLAVVGLSTMNSSSEKVDNAKVVSDIETLNNALLSYSQDNGELPMPGGNKNFFKVNTDYAHSYSGSETFGVYGSITENTIAKKYLDILPLDPRTNSYYAYGKTKESNEFEISGVQMIDGEYKAIVSGNYTAENGPYNLIREYNGADFVYNDSTTNLPYNPEELVLIATDAIGNIFREGDIIRSDSSSIYKNNVVLYNTTEDLELFFSDGSVSILEKGSEITLNKLNFPKENNLTTFIQIALETGTIWTRATNLNDESEFQIYTTDSTAAVRGTIFGVSYNPSNGTDVVVVEGKVEVIANELDTNGNEIIIAELNTGDSVKTKNQEIITGETPAIEVNNYENRIKIKFHINSEIRNENEIIGLLEENNNSTEEKQVEIETKNCMFNGEEVEEGEDTGVFAYSTKISTSCDSYKQEVKCIEGNIIVDSAYRYNSCNAPGNCGAYDKNGYNEFSLDIPALGTTNISRTEAYTNAGIAMGVTTYTKTIQCNDTGTDYIEGTETSSLLCTSPMYESNGLGGCRAVAVTCSIGDLTGGTENADGKCVVDLPIPTATFSSEIDLDTTDYEILINGNPITLNNISEKFKIKWKDYGVSNGGKRYTIFHVSPSYSSEDYSLSTFTTFQIREKDDEGAGAGAGTPTTHVGCGDCESYITNELHNIGSWDNGNDTYRCTTPNVICKQKERKFLDSYKWKEKTWIY